MSKLCNMVFISCCMIFSATAGVEVTLSGTVNDSKGAAIAGAIVTLVSDTSLKAATNASGEFILSNITAIASRDETSAVSVRNTDSFGIKGDQLRFSIAAPTISGAISIFKSNGKKSVVLPLGSMEPGVHTQALPELAAGFYVMNITIDQSAIIRKLVNTGTEMLLSNNASVAAGASRILRRGSAASADTIIVKKDGFTTTKQAITSYKQTGIAIVMADQPVYAYSAAVENTCADCAVPELPDAGKLTAKNSKLPDPFKKFDGSGRIAKKSEWRCQRQLILRQAMKYIYGDKPAPPAVVSGTVTNTKISVHVEENGKKIDFSATVKLPTTGQAPYPAIISMGGGSTVTQKAGSQGVAVITYSYTEVGKEQQPEGNVDRNKDFQGLFYDIYGGKHSAGLLMAWAWGASRIIDVLQKSGGDIIDYRRLGVTGCSRAGKGAFAVGLFDERIALILPEETSLGGIVAYRVADAKCNEKTPSNFNGQFWFSNNFKPFVSNTSLLPIDAHALIATVAPRGFYGLENSSSNSMAQQMCPQGGNMSVMGAAEVYKALGCSQNLSYNSTPTDINHCSYSEKFTKSLTENIKKFLLNQPGETGKIEAGTKVPTTDWIDWTAPTLTDDTDLYTTD